MRLHARQNVAVSDVPLGTADVRAIARDLVNRDPDEKANCALEPGIRLLIPCSSGNVLPVGVAGGRPSTSH